MIILIGGASHVGKTRYAQKLLEQYHWPYLSVDHLKMGLIRSGNTHLTPMDDAELTEYLWPIVREMIKTAIENQQNLIVEGCYIPFDWYKDLEADYLKEIRCLCLVMTPRYIQEHFEDIRDYANVIERRLGAFNLTPRELMEQHQWNLEQCRLHGWEVILMDEKYEL